MPRSGPRKVGRYSDEFKLTAVRLSQQPGIQVQTVAAALEIHPFMLSKWRKDVKDGRLRGRPAKAPPPGPAREIAQLQALERKYAELQEEHDLLKKPSGSGPLEKRPLLLHPRPRHAVRRPQSRSALSPLRRHARGVLCVAPPPRKCARETGPRLDRGDRSTLRDASRALWQSSPTSRTGERRLEL